MENDTLFWHGDQVWPERLALLRRESHLRRLILWGGSLTSDRLAGLGDLVQLTALAIGECPVDRRVFAHVRPLSALSFLNLSYTDVDGGFDEIAALPITELVLEGCSRIGDTALDEIAGWTGLRLIDLRRTGVSEAAMARFGQRRPGYTIQW